MRRSDLAAVALRALPAATRASAGEEILGTLMDATETASRTRFARELGALVHSGLRARTAGLSARRLVADGFCRGAILVMTLDLSTLLSQRLDGLRDPLLSSASISALAVTLAAALLGAERLAGLAALGWALVRLPQLAAENPTFAGIAPSVVPLVCFTVMIVAPRRRGLDLRRLGWLLSVVALVTAFGHWNGIGPVTAVVSLAAVTLMVAAVVTVASDPRLAIACALPATYVALTVAGKTALPAMLLLTGAPLTLAVAVVSARRRPQPTTL